MNSQETPVLLYDGTCGFCAESVQFVLEHDTKADLRFAALDSNFGRSVIARHPEVRGFDSMLYVEPTGDGRGEHVFAHSAAAIKVASYLGGAWRLLSLTRVVPTSIRDAVYKLIARHRHKLSGTGPQCVIPTANQRARFLE